MSDCNGDVPVKVVASPPPAAQPPKSAEDPGAELARLRERLMRGGDRRLMVEYLRLRRALR